MNIPVIHRDGGGIAKRSMSDRAFLDTNILLYAHDRADPVKQARAREVIASGKGDLVISTQVLQEFFVGATRKLHVPPQAAKRAIQALGVFEIVTVSPTRIFDAIDIHILNQISFWDALIVSAAEAAHCAVLLTEDLNHGQMVNGIRIENPFQ
jgi:predicted nucleic acid-binding protein